MVFAGYLHQAAGYWMMLHDFSYCFHDIAACLSCLVLALESTSYLSSHQFGFTTTSTDFDRLVGSLGSVPRVLHLSLGGMQQQQQGCFTGSLTAAANSADVMLQQLRIKNFVFVYFRLTCHYCSKCDQWYSSNNCKHPAWRPRSIRLRSPDKSLVLKLNRPGLSKGEAFRLPGFYCLR